MKKIIERTNSNTFWVCGTEYNEYPPPAYLLKSMQKQHTLTLIQYGSIRIQKIDYFVEIENKELGDVDEGEGMYQLEENPIRTSSGNNLYIWCCSMPNTKHHALINLSENYDVIIKIEKIEEFVSRLQESLSKKYPKFHVHCGKVKYDRGKEISRKTIAKLKWNYNAFQKNHSFAHQKEYRIVFTDVSEKGYAINYLDMSIGDCSDIIKIIKET